MGNHVCVDKTWFLASAGWMKLRICLFWIIAAVLVIDLWWISTRDKPLITWIDVALVALMLFLAAGERIAKFAVGTKGLSFEQKVNATATEARAMASLARDAKPSQIEELLSSMVGHERDVWSQMIMARIAMRSLLRRIVANASMQLGDATSFKEMLNFVKENNLLAPGLQRDIETIRDVTFFFEWGTGEPPTARNIKKVLRLAPKTLEELAESIKE